MPKVDKPIWFTRPSSELINASTGQSLVEHLDIKCDEVGDDYLRFSMPVDRRTKQPYGVLHGGASVALAETIGSVAALYCVDPDLFDCFGIEINANHVRTVRSGRVSAVARPLHVGRSTQVWSIRIENEEGELVCISRLTLAVKKKRG